MDEVGGEAKEEGYHKKKVVLLFVKFIEVGEAVVHEEVGNRNLGVKDDREGTAFDVGAKSREETGEDGGA